MKIRENLSFMLTGWFAGLVATLAFGLFWPVMFPAIIQYRHYTIDSGLLFVLGILLIVVSPISLIGGLIGSRLPKEGGRAGQVVMAAIFGIILALPVSCLGLWYLTGN